MTCMKTNYPVMSRFGAAVLAAFLALPLPLAAQDITLISLDGSVKLTGQPIAVANDNYVLRGKFGEVQVPTSKMRCEGADCPVLAAPMTTLRIAGSDTIGEDLMPLLISGLAEKNGAAVRKRLVDETTAALEILAEEGRGAEIYNTDLQFKGSGTGFAALLEGAAEIAMASRPVKAEVVEAFAFAGLGDPTDVA